MDTKKLAALLETVRIGSINRAAAELGYTQSGLTYALNTLEEEVGLQMLKRTHSGICLTQEGEQLYPFVREIVEREAVFQREAARIRTRDSRKVRIGVYSSLVIHWLPTVLSAFQKLHPDVEFEIRTGCST